MKLPKILLLLAICSWLFAFITSPVLAVDDTTTGASSLEKFQKTILENRGDSTTPQTVSRESFVGDPESSVLSDTVNGLTTMIVGSISCPPGQTCRLPGGAIGGINSLITALYTNPPASSVEYFADLGRNLGIIKPVYAQTGIGFQGLSPILPLWKAFRNIAYLFFTIIFVIMGFAIMFRTKIDPQTVISIQNAIPRAVVALILVTFSYAIAGLLIDLIYIGIALVITIFSTTGFLPEPAKVQAALLGSNPLALVFGILGGAGGAVNLIKATLNEFIVVSTITGVIGLIAAAANVGGLIAGILAPAVILVLFVAVVLLWAALKTFYILLMAYISIILSVIFGPLQIMLNAIPGQNSFGGWLRNLFANIAVFPAVAAMFILGRILTGSVGVHIGESGWTPPMLGVANPDSVRILIGLGILLMTPKVGEMVKDALKIKPSPYKIDLGPAGWAGRAAAGGAEKGFGEWVVKKGPGEVGKIGTVLKNII